MTIDEGEKGFLLNKKRRSHVTFPDGARVSTKQVVEYSLFNRRNRGVHDTEWAILILSFINR